MDARYHLAMLIAQGFGGRSASGTNMRRTGAMA
jgi:hypothetical protein